MRLSCALLLISLAVVAVAQTPAPATGTPVTLVFSQCKSLNSQCCPGSPCSFPGGACGPPSACSTSFGQSSLIYPNETKTISTMFGSLSAGIGSDGCLYVSTRKIGQSYSSFPTSNCQSTGGCITTYSCGLYLCSPDSCRPTTVPPATKKPSSTTTSSTSFSPVTAANKFVIAFVLTVSAMVV